MQQSHREEETADPPAEVLELLRYTDRRCLEVEVRGQQDAPTEPRVNLAISRLGERVVDGVG